MKLRMQSNSIRLRLKKGDVEKLVKTGRVEELVEFGTGDSSLFLYVLEASQAVSAPSAILLKQGILVQVPAQMVTHWASSDEVGIETRQPTGNDNCLQILIEKDFACLNGPEDQNVDTFPNPLAGTKC